MSEAHSGHSVRMGLCAFFFAQLKVDVVGRGFLFFGFFRIAVMRWDVSGIGHKA